MNVIAQLEFELTFLDVAIQHVNYYVMRPPLKNLGCMPPDTGWSVISFFCFLDFQTYKYQFYLLPLQMRPFRLILLSKVLGCSLFPHPKEEGEEGDTDDFQTKILHRQSNTF